MDNTGRMSGTINKQWFLYQEKEVFQDKKARENGFWGYRTSWRKGRTGFVSLPNLFISWFLWDMKC